ncbi:oxidoreductase with NAD+ or NADP+ as acceptor [Saitozyma sp. JCM 24511]|nr:oxidoreductase with NAD+ or NADP+ as acceptor [Saitozyma sp. JCM 24511]
MHVSVRESLRKLRTDYLDYSVSVEELMDSLDALVKAGKVLYLGASNLPAWFVAGCNSYARAKGQATFVILQTKWNVPERDIERELLPMAQTYGMAIAPWSALASGRLQSENQLAKLQAEGTFRKGWGGDSLTKEEMEYCKTLTEVAVAHGLGDESVAPVALAYLMTKYPLVFPIVAFHTAEQLSDNIRALTITLTDAEMKRLESIKPLDLGFPLSMIGEDPKLTGVPTGSNLLELGPIDWLVDKKVYLSQLDK